MHSAVETNPVGFILKREDTCEMAMTAAEEDLVEETEYRPENTHHNGLPSSFKSICLGRKKARPKGSKERTR